MRNEPTLRIEELLAHTGWLRSLARGLVSDEALAEDLVQESLLRALDRPPERSGALGAWLRRVVERLATRSREQSRRRQARERAAARPERSEETPAELLERVELQGRLVERVVALEEPLRSVVLLRYFESWSAERIARHQGVDVTTVRWRLRKAIERLRERLDREHGGREVWSAALAPLFLGRGAPSAAAGCGAGVSMPMLAAARSVVLGALAMKAKTVVVAAVVSILILGLGLLLHVASQRAAAPPQARPESAPAGVETARVAPPLTVPATAPSSPPPTPAVAPPEVTAPTKGATISGFVVEGDSAEPIAGAKIRVRGGEGLATSGEDGAYRLDGLSPGLLYLVASAQGYAEEHARAEVADEGGLVQDFRLESAIELLVTVVDEVSEPLEGVEVTPAQPNGSYVHGEGYSRFTDSSGQTRIAGIGRRRQQQINARKDGFHEVWTRDYAIDPALDESELRIVLKTRPEGDGVVDGKVTDASGAPLAGVSVQWIHSHGEHKGRVVTETAADGSYRLVFLRDQDWCTVSAFAEGFAPSIREGVRPGTAEQPARVDFTLAQGHWLEGEVLDEEGQPVEGASVRAMPTIYLLRNTPQFPGNVRECQTDERGRFALRDLAGPTTALRIHGPPGADWGHNYHEKIEVDRKVTLRLVHFGVLRGRVLDRESGEPVPAFGIKLKKGVGYYDYARSDPGELFNSLDGTFELRQLDQGPIEFLLEAPGYLPKQVRDLAAGPEGRAPEHEIRITQGKALEGVVVDRGSGLPLQGARIAFGEWQGGDLSWDAGSIQKMPDLQELVTGADGAFRILEGEPGTLFVQRRGYARLVLSPSERAAQFGSSWSIAVALEPAATLVGTLYADGQKTKEGFLVLFRERAGKSDARREWIGNLDRDSEGHFRLEELQAGDYLLEHWRETPGKRTAGLSIRRPLRLEAGQETALDFGADLGSLVFRGRALGPAGKPYERMRLTLRPGFTSPYSEFAATVTAEHDGRFHFLGLRPGRYQVEASRPGKPPAALPDLEISADQEQDLVVAFTE